MRDDMNLTPDGWDLSISYPSDAEIAEKVVAYNSAYRRVQVNGFDKEDAEQAFKELFDWLSHWHVPLWWDHEGEQFTLTPQKPKNGILFHDFSDIMLNWGKYTAMFADGSVKVIRMSDTMACGDGGLCIVPYAWYQRALAEKEGTAE